MSLKWLQFCLVSAALFFGTYDFTKSLLGSRGPLAAPHMAPVTHMIAASLGETVSLIFSEGVIFVMLLHFAIVQKRPLFKNEPQKISVYMY